MNFIANHRIRTVSIFAVFPALLALAGCGTGEYEARYEKKIQELWRLEPFLELQTTTTEIPLTDADTKVSISALLRIPNIFDKHAKRYEPTQTGEEPVDPERKFPPFVRSLPDFRFSYERFLGAVGKLQEPVYLYVCATQGRNPRFEDVLTTAIAKASDSYKKSSLENQWMLEEYAAPDQSKIEWRRLSLSLPKQTFAIMTRDAPDKKELDGIVEVFVHSDGDRHVMFILRMPTSLEKELDLAQLAVSMAGTLKWSDGEKQSTE